MAVLFNINTRSAYEAGSYQGTHPIGYVLARGGFGLGALHGNDGDLVIEGGRAYRTAFDGSTSDLSPDATVSYGTVVDFTADHSFEVTTAIGREDFEKLLAASVPLADRIWALRISGVFTHVTSGASKAQRYPYRPLAEVLPEYNFLRHEDIAGTLVSFYNPEFLSGICLAGLHYHWLSGDHSQGGHVTDFAVQRAVVEACEATGFTFELASHVAR
jgi:acetolactate decarboxylase